MRCFAAALVCAALAVGCSSISEEEAIRLQSENANLRADIERLVARGDTPAAGEVPTGADAKPRDEPVITVREVVDTSRYGNSSELIAGLSFGSRADALSCVTAWQLLFDSGSWSVPEMNATLDEYEELVVSFDGKSLDEREWWDYEFATLQVYTDAVWLHVAVVDTYKACVERSADTQAGRWLESANSEIFDAALLMYHVLEITDRARGECKWNEEPAPSTMCDSFDVLRWWQTASRYTPRAIKPASPDATLDEFGSVIAFPEGGRIDWPHYVNRVGVLKHWADADQRTTVVGLVERQAQR